MKLYPLWNAALPLVSVRRFTVVARGNIHQRSGSKTRKCNGKSCFLQFLLLSQFSEKWYQRVNFLPIVICVWFNDTTLIFVSTSVIIFNSFF